MHGLPELHGRLRVGRKQYVPFEAVTGPLRSAYNKRYVGSTAWDRLLECISTSIAPRPLQGQALLWSLQISV